MKATALALMVVVLLTGCPRNPNTDTSLNESPTSSPPPKRILRDLTEKERFELLEQAMKDYQRAMESSNREDKINGLKALLPEKSDFEKAFIKDAAELFVMCEEALYKPALENIDMVAKQELEFGALVKISIDDLRKKDRMSDSMKKDLAIMAPDVPVVQIYQRFERGGVGGRCLLWVDGRWVIIPEFGDLQNSLETWRKKK